LLNFFKGTGKAVSYLSAEIIGTVAGMFEGTILLIKTGKNPVRRDPEGQEIRAVLQEKGSKSSSPQSRQL